MFFIFNLLKEGHFNFLLRILHLSLTVLLFHFIFLFCQQKMQFHLLSVSVFKKLLSLFYTRNVHCIPKVPFFSSQFNYNFFLCLLMAKSCFHSQLFGLTTINLFFFFCKITRRKFQWIIKNVFSQLNGKYFATSYNAIFKKKIIGISRMMKFR